MLFESESVFAGVEFNFPLDEILFFEGRVGVDEGLDLSFQKFISMRDMVGAGCTVYFV